MIEVEGPDGSIAEFPDGTSPTVIKAAMQKRFASPPPGYGGASVDTSDPRARWDIPGDIQRAAGEAYDALKADAGNALAPRPRPPERSFSEFLKAAPGEMVDRAGDSLSRMGSALKVPLDAMGVAASPLIGTGRGIFGSAFSYLPAMDKTKGDAMFDQGMMGIGPRGYSAGRPVPVNPKAPAPSVGDLKSAADASYTAGRASGLEINPQSTAKLADDITAQLTQDGHRDYLQPKTFRAIQELKNPVGATVNISDVDGVRRILGNAAGDPAESRAASVAIKSLDRYLGNVPAGDVVAGDAAVTSKLFQEGRANYSAAKRAELIDTALEKADRQAASAGSGANIDNATRQRLKELANDPKKTRGFSDEEMAQLEKAIRGTWTGDTLRVLGNLLGGGGGMGTAVVAGLGGATVGPAGVGLPALGYAAKRLGAASTSRQAGRLSESLRSRSPLGQAMAQQAQNTRLPRSPILDVITFGIDAGGATQHERASAFFD